MAWRFVRQEHRERFRTLVAWTIAAGLYSAGVAEEFRGGFSDMALVIEGEERIAASLDMVWAGLNDPEILKACIPGCESLEKRTDTELAAIVVLKIGPIKAKFAGEVT